MEQELKADGTMNKVCCLFDGTSTKDEFLNRLVRVKKLYDGSWTELYLCRCKNCGAHVLYEHEEVTDYCYHVDEEMINDYFTPIGDVKLDAEGKVHYETLGESEMFTKYYSPYGEK